MITLISYDVDGNFNPLNKTFVKELSCLETIKIKSIVDDFNFFLNSKEIQFPSSEIESLLTFLEQ